VSAADVRDQRVQEELSRLIRTRPAGSTPAAAIREFVLDTEAGRRTRQGQSQNQIANELRPVIEAMLDDLARWLTSEANRQKTAP
jgi:hypothetical protein